MSSVGVEFVLKATSAQFTRALAGANNAVQDIKKGLRSFDVGNGLKNALGVGGVIAGFRMAITNAMELRDAADKVGKSIDSGTRSVAQLGDAIGGIGRGFKNALTDGLSFFTQIGDKARRFFQNVTEEQEESARKMADATGKAAEEAEKRLAKSREDNSPEKKAEAQEKLNKAEREGAAKGTEAQKKLINLINEGADLEEKLQKLPPNTTEAINIRTQIAENEKARSEAAAAFDKEASEKTEKMDKGKKALVNQFAPSVEELAKQDLGGFFSGSDPRLKARGILKDEDLARTLFDRGDYKGGLAAAQRAQAARKGLEGQTSDSGVLTPKAAEDAFTNALKTTNTEIEDLKKAVEGIIKSQP